MNKGEREQGGFLMVTSGLYTRTGVCTSFWSLGEQNLSLPWPTMPLNLFMPLAVLTFT